MNRQHMQRIARKSLFWEVPVHRIAQVIEESPAWVVQWIFEYGSLKDVEAVILLYGADRVRELLREVPMTPMVRSMAYVFLDYDPEGYYTF